MSKKLLTIPFFIIASLFLVSTAYADNTTIFTTADTSVIQNEVGTKDRGNATILDWNRDLGSAWSRTYIRFNLTDFFNSNTVDIITNATFIFNWTFGTSNQIESQIYNVSEDVVNLGWVEGDGTVGSSFDWSTQPCGSATTSLNASCNSTQQFTPAPNGAGTPRIEGIQIQNMVTHLIGNPVTDKSITVVVAHPQSPSGSRVGNMMSKENIFAPRLFLEFAEFDVTAPTIETIVTDPVSPQTNPLDDFSNVSVQFNATIVDETALSTVFLNIHGVNITPSTDGSVHFTTQDVLCNVASPLNDWFWITVDSSGNTNTSAVQSFSLTCASTPPEVSGTPAVIVSIIALVVALGGIIGGGLFILQSGRVDAQIIAIGFIIAILSIIFAVAIVGLI